MNLLRFTNYGIVIEYSEYFDDYFWWFDAERKKGAINYIKIVSKHYKTKYSAKRSLTKFIKENNIINYEYIDNVNIK